MHYKLKYHFSWLLHLSNNFHFSSNFTRSFFFFRLVPAHVLVFRHSSTSFWGISIDPCLNHGKPGIYFNFTLYHLILFASFKSTTFSTCSWEFLCCCLTGVVGSCIPLSVLWYWPWPDFFLLLLLPLLFRCCITCGNVLLSLCCVAVAGFFCPWFCGGCGAASWLRWSAWLSGSSRLYPTFPWQECWLNSLRIYQCICG